VRAEVPAQRCITTEAPDQVYGPFLLSPLDDDDVLVLVDEKTSSSSAASTAAPNR
jgi:hypothetical protein